MERKHVLVLFGLVALTIAALVIGCGQQGSQTASATTTILPSGATVSISGILKSGLLTGAAVSAAGVRAQATAFSAVPDYSIAAVSKDTGNVYFASSATDASGNFTIPDLPAGESYYMEVLDSSCKLAAPVAFGTAGGKAVMAIETGDSSSIALGDIAYDSNKGAAAPTVAQTALLDPAAAVETKSGETLVPKGAENFGKGSETEISSGAYLPNTVDGDKDGLPNILDADNNGDLVVDELDGMFTAEVLAIAPSNFFSYAFCNLKVDYNNRTSYKTDYREFDLAVGVTPNNKGGTARKTISSVKVIDGPAWISKATVSATGTSADGHLWSASSYNIPKRSGMDAYEVHLQGLKPVADVNTGDALKFNVAYTDGTSEESLKMINFVFTDIPQVQAIKIGSSPWREQPLTFPTAANSSEVRVRWLRPKDESGSEIIGGRYTFEYNSLTGGAIETTVITRDAGTLASLEATVDFKALPNADITSNMLIGVCIRSVANDNAAENIWFNRQNW